MWFIPKNIYISQIIVALNEQTLWREFFREENDKRLRRVLS